MPVEYGNSGPKIDEPVARLNDENCGIKGVVTDSYMKDAYEFNPGSGWTQKFWKDGNPVQDFVFIVACESGQAYFPVIGPDGEAVKTASNEMQLELRQIQNEDIAIICGSAWSVKAVKKAKLNDGHQFTFRRLSPAGAKDVQAELEVLGKVDNPQRYKAKNVTPVSYGDDSPFPGAAAQPAQPPAGQPGQAVAADPFTGIDGGPQTPAVQPAQPAPAGGTPW